MFEAADGLSIRGHVTVLELKTFLAPNPRYAGFVTWLFGGGARPSPSSP